MAAKASQQRHKAYKFWVHYNKPLSLKAGVPIWTVHYRGKCYYAENVICKSNINTRTRATQPRGVFEGRAKKIVQAGKLITIQ